MKLDCKHVWEHISEYIDNSVEILDSTRNILVLTADDRTFELPVGYSERLHKRLAKELASPEQDSDDK